MSISTDWLEANCAKCHGLPPNDAFSQSTWKPALAHMLDAAGISDPNLIGISIDRVAEWYEQRAPAELPLASPTLAAPASELPIRRHAFRLSDFRFFGAPAIETSNTRSIGPAVPGVSNVRLLDLIDDERLELVVCDMWNGLVLLGRPYSDSRELEILARTPFPARAELADLDGDGRRDLIVADLGSLMPADHQQGGVIWLRNAGDRGFEAAPLLSGVGRVADVRAADFDGDGDLDLIVAEFGWRATGRILLLNNETSDWAAPSFQPQLIDPRHGTIHIPVIDLDHDGRLDFVALIAQEHEVVVAFLNRGDLKFEPHELYRAPHPAWGSSGLELVDLDGDSDTDMLVTNGDSSDLLPKLRPYHGVAWLENVAPGTGSGPPRFVRRELVPMYGVHRADAADLDRDGDLDIVACSFIPMLDASGEARRTTLHSILWLEQTAPGQFQVHSLEQNQCEHATLALADYDRDGDVDIAIGHYVFEPSAQSEQKFWVDLWENEQPAEP